ncbi:MAG: prepilin-type N-terminal cleavage/methylation domain-containing protein [Verrucomicrobiales bacterium]
MKITKKNPLVAGFSLVEMLVVIAVIGIIAAIAIPNIGKINDSAKDARKRRNAQSIASVFAAANAAGLDFSTTPAAATTEADVIANVITGSTIAEATSPFNGATFSVKGVVTATAQSETDGAAKYLAWDATNGILTYSGGE